MAEGILPIQLSITNVGDHILMTAASPQLRGRDGELWAVVTPRDAAKQIRRSASLNGLMAKTPFLGLLAAPFGLILAPLVGGTAELLASHTTTEANHEMADDIVGFAFRQVAIKPGDTYRAFIFFHLPPATAATVFTQVVLTVPIEDAYTRRTSKSAIAILPPAFYTRPTIWDRPLAGPMRLVEPPSSSRRAEIVLTGLQTGPTPVEASIHYEQAVAAAQDGEWKTAIGSLSQTVKADEAYGEAFFARGVLRARQGHFSEAAADFSRAIDLDYRLTDIFNYRGIVLARLGRDEEAVGDWNTAIKLSPNFPLPLYNRGMLSWGHGRPDAAKKDFEVACSLGFDPACFALSDLETHWPCCPPGTSPIAESKRVSSPRPAP
jgi:hypothetical protein